MLTQDGPASAWPHARNGGAPLRRDRYTVLDDDGVALLMSMSPASIDRHMADGRNRLVSQGHSHIKSATPSRR